MADIDIDLLEITTQGLTSQQVKIFLSPQEEDQLGNQNVNKKHHLEEKVKELNSSKNMLKGCIKSYLKARVKPQKHFILIISNSEMGNCTTKARASP